MDFTLYDPINQPYRGLRTYPDGPSVPPGYWKEAKNIRVDAGGVKLRGGETSIVAGPTNADACYGGIALEYGSYVYVYSAVHISTDASTVIRLYVNQYTIASDTWGGWIEVSAASGAYGNTRMTKTNGLFSFTPVPTLSTDPAVVVQNGTDYPRLIIATQSAKIEEINAPTWASTYKPVFGFSAKVSTTATATATNSTGARFAASQTGTSKYWRWTFTTPTASDTAELALSSGSADFSGGLQLAILADIRSAGESYIHGCKWEIKSGGNYYTIHDPTNGVDSLVSSETDIPGVRLYGFGISEHSSSLTSVTGLRLTVVNAGLTAGGVLDVWAVLCGGQVPGFSEYAISYLNTATRTESAGVVMPLPTQGATADTVLGTLPDTLKDKGFSFPLSQAFYYSVSLPTVRVGTNDRDKGVNTIIAYRKDPGESDFYYCNQWTCCSYSGSWAYSGDYASATKYIQTENAPEWTKDDGRPAPSAYNEACPIGNTMIYASRRSHVGTNKTSGKPFNCVKVSDENHGLRFRSIGSPNEGEGFLAELDGSEVVKGFAASSASVIGASTVYCFTDRAHYIIDGPLVRRVASIGARAGITENQGAIYWLDNHLSVRRALGQIENISRLRVDDVFTGATNTQLISGAFHRDRLYLAYSGGVIVYSELLGDWESIDTPSVQPKVFLPWTVNGESKLYCLSATGGVYRYDYGNDDAGTEIAFRLKTGDIHTEDWARVSVGRSKIVSSDKNSETMTVTYTASSPAGTKTGTINLDAGGSETTAWKQDKQSAGNDASIAGASVNIQYDATISGPFTLSALVCDVLSKRGVGHGN